MTPMEITLLVIGVIIFVVSFFIKEKPGERSEEDIEQEQREIRQLMEHELDNMKLRVNDAADETVEYAMDKAERSLEKISNEKIMAVSDYSNMIMEEIDKSHKEVMFLYDMLSDKQTDVKNSVRKAEAAVKEVKEVYDQSFQEVHAGYDGSSQGVSGYTEGSYDQPLNDQAAFEMPSYNPPAYEMPSTDQENYEPDPSGFEPLNFEEIYSGAGDEFGGDPQTGQSDQWSENTVIKADKPLTAIDMLKARQIEVGLKPVFNTLNPESYNQEAISDAMLTDPQDVFKPVNFERVAQPQQQHKQETAPVRKEEPKKSMGSFMKGFGVSKGNNNQKIIELHEQGKSTVDIAKELNLGVGEVKLVIDLYK